MSTMPAPRPVTPKRPKLSLQTSTLSTRPANNCSMTALSHFSSVVDSPTTFRNTNDNAFEAPPPTPVSANPRTDEAFTQLRQQERPTPHTASSSPSISTLSSGPTSPFASTTPYTLAIGAKSILRNSPLPWRYIANLPNRPQKRIFRPTKRVSFPETLVETIPTPVLSDSDVDSVENTELESTAAAGTRTASDQRRLGKSDGKLGRRKRRGRDWIWRPVDDEASMLQVNGQRISPTTTFSAEV
ncbi:MAG: hypothetical protein LQ343_000357 [Gyalolechia ehrenbergii]|nr:MAG: hypothetical protein LQ343_000357 [Gyalolechia ehrenbergii]